MKPGLRTWVMHAGVCWAIMAAPIAVFACSRLSVDAVWRPCGVCRPATLFPGLFSAGSITSITLGSPEPDRGGLWKACGNAIPASTVSFRPFTHKIESRVVPTVAVPNPR